MPFSRAKRPRVQKRQGTNCGIEIVIAETPGVDLWCLLNFAIIERRTLTLRSQLGGRRVGPPLQGVCDMVARWFLLGTMIQLSEQPRDTFNEGGTAGI